MAAFDERFHVAAAEGRMDTLRQAAKRDCNKPNDIGMTPTLLAASKGHMAALRLLVSRGGNPDICDNQGYTALHFAALNGNISVVTFLVSFGCNIWALTNDYRTALQLAKENEHHQIADMLDEVFNEQSAKNQHEVLRKRKAAIKDVEERNKKNEKMWKRTLKKEAKQQKKMSIQNGVDVPLNSDNKKSISSASGKSAKKGSTSYPALMGSQRNVVRSIRERDPNIQYGPQMSLYDDGSGQQKEAPVMQGSRMGDLRGMSYGNAGASLGAMMKEMDSKQNGDDELVDGVVTTFNKPLSKSISNGSAKVPVGLQQDAIDDVGDEVSTPLELFLAVNELSDYLHVFLEEDIDLKALMLLTEKDLEDQLRLGLGPRRKILQAMENRKRATEHAKAMSDSFV